MGLQDNDALEDLSGLESIETIPGNLYLNGNAVLRDISALHGLASVGGRVEITQHPCLPSSAVDAFLSSVGAENIDGEVVISENDGPC